MDDLGGCLVVDTRMVVVEQMVRVGPGDPVGGGAHGADEVFVVKFVVSFFFKKNNDVFDNLPITCPQTLCDVLNLAPPVVYWGVPSDQCIIWSQ